MPDFRRRVLCGSKMSDADFQKVSSLCEQGGIPVVRVSLSPDHYSLLIPGE
jgi:hypothetical protein